MNTEPDIVEQSARPKRGRAKRRLILLLLLTVVVAGGAGYAVYWSRYGQFRTATDDAYVAGNVVAITSQVSGTVVAIAADDTQFVRQGEPIVRLDPADARVAYHQAQAQLAQTVRTVRQLFEVRDQARANVNAQQANLAQAHNDFDRAKGLLKSKGISTQQYQHAGTKLANARATLTEARHRLAASEAAVDGTTLENHPQIKLAEARLRSAYLDLQRTTLVAPVSGYVAKRTVQLGQHVAPGSDLLAIVPLNQVWVDANFKETELANVRIGQPVILESDLYGGRQIYHGKVAGLGAGTGGAFALLPAQNASGNWIKVVQRLPVRIALDPAELARHPLRIGLSMTATIDTRDRSGPVLASSPPKQPAYTTDVYAVRQQPLKALIAGIIQANSAEPGLDVSGRTELSMK